MTIFTLPDLLAERAVSHRTAIAVEQGEHVALTYGELSGRVAATAATLRDRGVVAGDRVAIFERNSVTALGWFLGAGQIGAVAVVVNDSLKPYQVEHIVRHSGAKLLVAGRRMRAQLDGVDLDCPLLDAQDVTAGSSAEPGVRPIGRDLAALIYTSGSTGLPKGVMVTHANLVAGAQIVARYLGLTSADRTLSVLPWSFDAGLNQVLATFVAGGTLVVAGSTFAPEICRALQRHRITGLAGIPPLWELVVNRPSPFLDLDLPDLRYIPNTGGVLRRATLRRIREAHPDTAVFLMYGLTEAFRSSYLPPDLVDTFPDSMGRAIPDTEILILDEAGRPCGRGEVGELVHRGPTVAAGYWRDPEATARVFRPAPFIPPGGITEHVVHSGDYVRRDERDLLYFVGRRDEQFKSRGFRVSPTEVEAGLLASDLVAGAVVFAEDRSTGGDPEIVAAVVPRDPADIEVDDLVAHCRATMPTYQWPTRFALLTDLPRTTSGKIDRAGVKDQVKGGGVDVLGRAAGTAGRAR